jgi:branched-chain amino acid transport system ATP-binding protein
MTTMLEVVGLSRRFGGVNALTNVAFSTEHGEIFGIIGPNGAGKTTLFNVVTGAVPPSSGTVRFAGATITRLGTDRIARMGLVRTFQATVVFKSHTVRENLRRGSLFSRLGRPLSLIRFGPFHTADAEADTKADEILAFLSLESVATNRAGDLAYGLQKILGVGMALAASPRMLLMDEPAAGLNPAETASLGALLLRVRNEWHIDVAVVEHDMQMIMGICDRIMVLNNGKVICIDTPARVRVNPVVIDAYLGTDHEFA